MESKCRWCAEGWPLGGNGLHVGPDSEEFVMKGCLDRAENQPGNNPLPCLICGTQLSHVSGEYGTSELRQRGYMTNQPVDGTAFDTGGHYGSTIFDSFEGEQLEIAICDPCLRARAERTRVLVPGKTTIRQLRVPKSNG